ncbi:hypothetical protein [Acidobacterium sp.]|uniref:hypothetical protein n=1 Tax=Acidobacterium sp. TaxID=1872119 RepID=UPI0011D14160|nr:hypothetical protein [Acidobacterium sp.]
MKKWCEECAQLGRTSEATHTVLEMLLCRPCASAEAVRAGVPALPIGSPAPASPPVAERPASEQTSRANKHKRIPDETRAAILREPASATNTSLAAKYGISDVSVHYIRKAAKSGESKAFVERVTTVKPAKRIPAARPVEVPVEQGTLAAMARLEVLDSIWNILSYEAKRRALQSVKAEILEAL